MQMRNIGLLTFVLVAGSTVRATTPPIYAPFEEQICRASHVFIGTSSDVRIVPDGTSQFCANTPPQERGTLTMCGSAEVDIKIESVLYPQNWTPPARVVYRFGGGFFSVDSLRTDLEGIRRLFHVTQVPNTNPPLFKSSQEWVLSAFPSDEARVRSVLASCKRAP
jgi:hypothetical protein